MSGAGTLIAIVGPSGAGKDTLISLAREAFADEPRVIFAIRIITRPPDATEANETLTDREFTARAEAGEFLLSWRANGVCYALPSSLRDNLAAGDIVVANLSRGVVAHARELGFPVLAVEVTASPAILAARLAARGREAEAGQRERLARNRGYEADFRADVTITNDAAPRAGAERLAGIIRACTGARSGGTAE